MRYLLIVLLCLCGCERYKSDRPLLYKSRVQRIETLYNQNNETLKALDRVNTKADALAEDIRELYKLVVELRLNYCSEESDSP